MHGGGVVFLVSAALAAVFWLCSLLVSAGRDDDRTFGAEYNRGLAEMSGVLVIWATTLGLVLLASAATGATPILGWGLGLGALRVELPVIRRLGQRYPALRLPVDWTQAESEET